MAGSEQRFHALVGKALTDPDFRAQLMSENVGEQKAALQSVGIAATEGDEIMTRLQAAISAVDNLAAAMGEQVAS